MIYEIKLYKQDPIKVEITDADEQYFFEQGWTVYKQRSANHEVQHLINGLYAGTNDDDTNRIMLKWLAKHNMIHYYNLTLMNEFRRLFSNDEIKEFTLIPQRHTIIKISFLICQIGFSIGTTTLNPF